MKDRTTILNAISDVLRRSSIYIAPQGTVEVERLYLLEDSVDSLVECLKSSAFLATKKVLQEDAFFDMRTGIRWQLADTDHYVRIRVVRDSKTKFKKGEIKVGYPGPLSNPNARYSPADLLSENEVGQWKTYLQFLGFQVEREYRKERVPFKCSQNFKGFQVELEADHFMHDDCNRKLAGESFVSLSIETEGNKRQDAELALDEVKKELERKGVKLIKCAGNYEYYFYGKPLPTSQKDKG